MSKIRPPSKEREYTCEDCGTHCTGDKNWDRHNENFHGGKAKPLGQKGLAFVAIPKQLTQASELEPSQSLINVAPSPASSPVQRPVPSVATSPQIPAMSPPPLPPVSIASLSQKRSIPPNVAQQSDIDELKSLVLRLESKINQLGNTAHPGARDSEQKDPEAAEDIPNDRISFRDFDGIRRAFMVEIEEITETDIIKVACVPCKLLNVECNVQRVHNPFAMGIEYCMSRANTEPKYFSNIVATLRGHLKSHIHRICIGNWNSLQERTSQVTMRLLRKALFTIKEGHSDSSYEDSVVLDHLNGLDVGNLHHGRQFVGIARKYINDEIDHAIQEFRHTKRRCTKAKPYFSLTSDKMTTYHRTRHIIMIKTLTNGTMKALLTGLPIISQARGVDRTGTGLTRDLTMNLDTIGLNANERSRRMMPGSWDGEYMNLHVPALLAAEAHLGEDWQNMCRIDDAHLLQTSVKHARENTLHLYLEENRTTCNEIANHFRWGKEYDAVRTLNDMLGHRWVEPKRWQDTRWVRAELQVFKFVLQDFVTLVSRLEQTNNQDLLPKMLNVRFVASLCFLIDVYEELTTYHMQLV